MTRVFLSLGSNLGDRRAHLRAALEALDRGPRMKLRRASRVYETAPVEVEEYQPDYLNCVAEIECGVSALELLRYCQGVESALGRERKGEKAAPPMAGGAAGGKEQGLSASSSSCCGCSRW